MAQTDQVMPPDPQSSESTQPPVITDDNATPGWVGYATLACLVVILLGVSVGGLVTTTIMWAVVGAVFIVLSPILVPLGVLFIISSLFVSAFLTLVSMFVSSLIWLIRYSLRKGP